jgi:hypothetical protein
MMQGANSGTHGWRRFLRPSLVSIGLHLFLLPLLLVITVTFADSIVGVSSWRSNDGDLMGKDDIIGTDFDCEKAYRPKKCRQWLQGRRNRM